MVVQSQLGNKKRWSEFKLAPSWILSMSNLIRQYLHHPGHRQIHHPCLTRELPGS
jgi:hypothetical protein